MPKFFYTISALTLLIWAVVIYFGSGTVPDSTLNIFLFVLGIFLALGLTFTTLAFLYFNHRASMFMNKHILFRRSIKYGFFASLCFSGFLLLRAFDLASVLNLVLFFILCAFLYMQLRSARTR